MKIRNLIKAIGSLLFVAAAIAAADPTYTRAGEVEIKRGGKDIRRPAVSLFASETKKPAAGMACGGCQSELKAVTTQDTKLRTKTLLVENHKCTTCKTTSGEVGPKGDRTTVTKHTCLAVASANCCAN